MRGPGTISTVFLIKCVSFCGTEIPWDKLRCGITLGEEVEEGKRISDDFVKKYSCDAKNILEINTLDTLDTKTIWNGFIKYFHKHSHYFSSSAWVMFGQKGNVLKVCCANISRVKNVFLTAPPFWRHQIRQPALYWQMYDQGEPILVFKRENVYCHRITVT